MNQSSPPSIQKIIAKAIQEADKSYFFEDYSKQANAVMQALKAANLTFMPTQPTERMIQAGIAAIGSGKIRPEDHVRYIFTDMIKEGMKEGSVRS
ncbi:MAG: hypothetical protein EAY76_00225 [Alphaproteobacteria bacterium]|nr:MAG: hypothetical protein EAY76_00225 [Alphaproteobacteria bacterium]TAF37807.1 MAG: hypothetical protein EAZ66_06880 [Alphaproteobacteria bacterium]TAF75871.1 MAG: hypothetical protein EAZ52_05230 [Alphaproteobacteria bacterium]